MNDFNKYQEEVNKNLHKENLKVPTAQELEETVEEMKTLLYKMEEKKKELILIKNSIKKPKRFLYILIGLVLGVALSLVVCLCL